MTKDVLVKISGLQFAEDQDNGGGDYHNRKLL